MKTLRILPVLLLTVASLSFTQETAFRRFGLFVGSNYGGVDRVTLQYATTDARGFSEVMYDLGGIERQDSFLLTNPNTGSLDRAFRKLRQTIREAGNSVRRTEFILYFSGHSDEWGLLLEGTRYSYSRLREQITTMGADVTIAILDSCSSGAFTRLKGGSRSSPFLLDESIQTSGYAFLTSSSENEAAQESDLIQASFFTHYLISALRGAADSTQDGQVSLNEAYSYAQIETLTRTTDTLAGPQHPSYDIKLTGSGDLVLTDLRETTAGIVIETTLAGRIFIKDMETGRLVVEVRKLQGIPMTLSLPPGNYEILLDEGTALRKTTVYLTTGRKSALADHHFSYYTREITRSRGDKEEPEEKRSFSEMVDYLISLIPFPGSEYRVTKKVSFNFIGASYRVEGFEGGFINIVQEDLRGTQLAAIMNLVGRNTTGVQAAGILNITEGAVDGVQLASIFNIAEEGTSGVQSAGVFNISSDDTEWAQLAGIFNITEGDVHGAQAAGIFNIADEDLRGFQGAGIFNITSGRVQGVQAAGIFNSADEVRGVQIGLVNIGDEVRGCQIGLVNISDDLYGVPIGLINISSNGLHHLNGWSDEKGMTYLGLQFGTRNFYSFAYGGTHFETPGEQMVAGFGWGLHFPIGAAYLEFDLSGKRAAWGGSAEENLIALFSASNNFPIIPAARIGLGIELGSSFAIFGGISIDGHIPGVTPELPPFLSGTPQTIKYNGTAVMELYPRWYAGIRI